MEKSCFINVVCERAVVEFGSHVPVNYMNQNTDPRKDKKTSHHCYTTSAGVWVDAWMRACSHVYAYSRCVSLLFV